MKSNRPATLPLNVAELLADFRSTGEAQGFKVEPFGQTTAFPLLSLTKRCAGPRPRIYLSAGIHGDEPAPPLALLEMLHAGVFDSRANWFICPALNPEGLHRVTREDAQKRDLNRDYLDRQSPEIKAHTQWLERQPAFQLTLCLHEDWEARGFYLYELNRQDRPSFAPLLLNAVRDIIPIDDSEIIDERPIDEPGIIRPISDPLLRTNWPEAIYLCQEHTNLSYTLETPTGFPLGKRTTAIRSAVEAAIIAAIHGFDKTHSYQLPEEH